MLMKKTLIILALLVLSGCNNSAEKTENVSNKSFDVEVLFTDSDGFTVKRFQDGGYYRYYVTGPTDAASVSEHSTSNGKQTSFYLDDIPSKRR